MPMGQGPDSCNAPTHNQGDAFSGRASGDGLGIHIGGVTMPYANTRDYFMDQHGGRDQGLEAAVHLGRPPTALPGSQSRFDRGMDGPIRVPPLHTKRSAA
jgi:hypothetical protein